MFLDYGMHIFFSSAHSVLMNSPSQQARCYAHTDHADNNS